MRTAILTGVLLALMMRPVMASEAAAGGSPSELPASQAVLDQREATGVLGKPVRSSAGQDLGRIVNVVTDRQARIRAAVVDFGGFMGVGDRKIAVDWDALQVAPDPKTGYFVVELTRNQIKDAPEYREGAPVVIVGGPFGIGGSGMANTAAGR